MRLFYIDNLRGTMILLVISMHAADTYSPLGNWYYVDRKPLSPYTLLFFAIWQMYLQSFFMGLLFFVAGEFVPNSLERKGTSHFIRDRAWRLGLPVLFYMFALGPVTEYFCAHSWTSTEPTSFINEWLKHIGNGQFLQENGPLWFCLALLIFSIAYVGWRELGIREGMSNQRKGPPNTLQLITFAVAMAVLTFAVRLVFPSGTSFLNMHLSDFPQYILLFGAGILAAREGWLPDLDFSAGVKWLTIVIPIGFAAWLALILKGGALEGNGSYYGGGWHWQAACLNLWESFTCVAISYGLLVIYAKKSNSQGPFSRFLSENAFSAYVFHPPILILCARSLHSIQSAIFVKFVLLTVAATITSFVLSATVFRRIPVLRRIL